MKLVLAVAVSLALCSASAAETTKANCKTMSQPMALTAQAVRASLAGVEKLRADAALASFSGKEKEAYQRLSDARAALLPVMEAYATALEDVAYAMAVCAR